MSFYFIVWLIGVLIFILVTVLYKTEYLNEFNYNLFWLGFILGLCWELPLCISDELGICCGYPFPAASFETPTPIQGPLVVIIIAITHSFWDGGLFLIITHLMYLILPKPYFEKFSWKEFGLLMIFGQVQELIVELIGTSASGWYFNIYWFNPPLFPWMGHYITLLPQLIWVGAVIAYYLIIIKYKPRLEGK